jgi:hypothetical protein
LKIFSVEYLGFKVPIVTCIYKILEPRRLTTLWASTACYRDSFTLFTLLSLVPLKFLDTECSFCRLIRRPEHLIGRHCGISRQTEGHSFGDHLLSESVIVTPSSVI